MEAVGKEYRLKYAIRPSGKRIEYVPRLGGEHATGPTHRDMPSSMTRGGRPESGSDEAAAAHRSRPAYPAGTVVAA
jgi:hypothetical protein